MFFRSRVNVVVLLLAILLSFSLATSPAGECIPVGESGVGNNFHCLDVTRTPAVPCKNEHESCETWKSQGECRSNPGYMLYHCRQACNVCLSLHVGAIQRLPQKKPENLRGFIELLVGTQLYVYSLVTGTNAARIINKCVNQHELCTYWKMSGECQANPSMMRGRCPAACEMCDTL